MSWKLPNKEFISIQELKAYGYTYYKINKLVSEGRLNRLNKKYYENMTYEGEANDFYAVTACSEKGVVCLLSAAVYYELSVERPAKTDVAVPRGTRIPKPFLWPTMRFYLFSDFRYSFGIRTINDNGNIFKIYDLEKTVCDIVLYRNKIGFETSIEIVKNYLNRPDRNLNRLMTYARELHVITAMRQFVEVMV